MSDVRWRKASFSQPNDDCVELAELPNGDIGVRDTKDKGRGQILRFTPAEMQAFLDGVKAGEFDDLG